MVKERRRSLLERGLSRFGFEIRRVKRERTALDLSPELARIIDSCRPYTMTSLERMASLHDAARYVAINNIPGALVECGVWRGGSAMNMAMTILGCGASPRDLWLFDTYSGMTKPSERDVDVYGRTATAKFEKMTQGERKWLDASVDDVRENMRSTGYPVERVHLIEGMVEETIPSRAPEQIALLRLDTDWFDSTKHELEHLFPRLTAGGVLILDDYGHWQGARQATDEYFARHGLNPLLFRIDYTGRMMVKGS